MDNAMIGNPMRKPLSAQHGAAVVNTGSAEAKSPATRPVNIASATDMAASGQPDWDDGDWDEADWA
jgi:hypothetical protein